MITARLHQHQRYIQYNSWKHIPQTLHWGLPARVNEIWAESTM